MSAGSQLAQLGRGAVTALTFVIILAPIVVVVVAAFSPTDFFAFPPPGFSWRWIAEFFRLDNMRGAFVFSIELALASACVGAVLGTLAAVSVARRRRAIAALLHALFIAPLVFPTIILGFALLLFYKTVAMPLTAGLLLAHAVVGMPYCFRTVLASLHGLDPAIEEAGQSLGAGPLRSFFLLTLPLIWPGVLSGWLFAFVVSFGELNTALFLTGPGATTLPIEIFSYLQYQGSQLVVAAASAIQVGLIILVVFGVQQIVGLGRIVSR
jgi:putative spermidine/putrescine transport system permease protein